MYCHKCGKQIPDGAGFCQYCGAAQTGAQSDPAPAQPERQSAPAPTAPARPQPERTKKKKHKLLLAVVIVLAAVGLFLAYALVSDGPVHHAFAYYVLNWSNPWGKVDLLAEDLESFEDIFDQGPEMAKLVVGRDESDIDQSWVQPLGDGRYGFCSLTIYDGLTYFPDCEVQCENGKVTALLFYPLDMLGSELSSLVDMAVSVYGGDYAYSENETLDGLVTLREFAYTWDHVQISGEDNLGFLSVTIAFK